MDSCRNIVTITGPKDAAVAAMAQLKDAFKHEIESVATDDIGDNERLRIIFFNAGVTPKVAPLEQLARQYPGISIMDEWSLSSQMVDGRIQWENGRIIEDLDWDRDFTGRVREGTVQMGIGLAAQEYDLDK